jgi:hypothetical protein
MLEDSGTVTIRMLILDGGRVKGARCGEAVYEPDDERKHAFWLENRWDGTLEQIIE